MPDQESTAQHQRPRQALSVPSGSVPKCKMCARRDGCMPYSDDQLQYGVENGHVPEESEHCEMFVRGNEYTREEANKNVEEFNKYAKDLMRSFSQNAKD